MRAGLATLTQRQLSADEVDAHHRAQPARAWMLPTCRASMSIDSPAAKSQDRADDAPPHPVSFELEPVHRRIF